jgi:hypothetical protein
VNSNESNSLYLRRWGSGETAEHPDGGLIWIRPPAPAEFPKLHDLLLSEVSPHASSLETMMSVFARNSDSFWVIEHLPRGSVPRLVGFEAFLPLNAIGSDMLQAGKLNGTAPPLWAIAPYGEEPAALYIWAIVAHRIGKRLSPLIARALGPLYRYAPIFALVATEGGRKSGAKGGFSPVGDNTDIHIGDLIRLPAHSERAAA